MISERVAAGGDGDYKQGKRRKKAKQPLSIEALREQLQVGLGRFPASSP